MVPLNAGARPQLPPPIRGLRAAFVFLTRIPVGGFPYAREDWLWASAHAPVVGLVVGLITGTVDRVLLPIGVFPAALLSIGASMLVTGAFHEDGLADTSDALGGAYEPARVLEILKDSRIGSFGGAALIVSIATRGALVAELGVRAWWVLPIVGAIARVGPIWLMAALPYVTADATAKSRDVSRGAWPQAAVATAWGAATIAVGIGLGAITGWRALAVLATVVAVTAVTGHRYRRRVGGITGDFLGATEQLGEIAVLAALAWQM